MLNYFGLRYSLIISSCLKLSINEDVPKHSLRIISSCRSWLNYAFPFVINNQPDCLCR